MLLIPWQLSISKPSEEGEECDCHSCILNKAAAEERLGDCIFLGGIFMEAPSPPPLSVQSHEGIQSGNLPKSTEISFKHHLGNNLVGGFLVGPNVFGQGGTVGFFWAEDTGRLNSAPATTSLLFLGISPALLSDRATDRWGRQTNSYPYFYRRRRRGHLFFLSSTLYFFLHTKNSISRSGGI